MTCNLTSVNPPFKCTNLLWHPNLWSEKPRDISLAFDLSDLLRMTVFPHTVLAYCCDTRTEFTDLRPLELR
jgi:hypothetical protein